MSSITPAIAAGGGAIVGALVAQVAAYAIQERERRRTVRRQVIEAHLFGLQDALESAKSRLHNFSDRHGRQIMEDQYYNESTLYVLGVLLAYKRRMLLEGGYARLDDQKRNRGADLRRQLELIEAGLGEERTDGGSFQRYERQALAESVLERTDRGWEIGSYLAFRNRYRQDLSVASALVPATHFVTELDVGWARRLQVTISAALTTVERIANVDRHQIGIPVEPPELDIHP